MAAWRTHQMLRAVFWVVLCGVVAGCNLTTRAPLPTPPPTAVPLATALPTIPPLAPGLDTGARLNDSTCLLTPANWVPYTVQPGDSLGALSLAVDTPLSELVANNCLDNADTLFVEQVIYLPRQP